MRCIATGSSERIPQLPDVGTVAEQGYPGFEMTQWYGVLAPSTMAPAAIDKLAAASARAMQSPKSTERLRGDAAIIVGSNQNDFARFILAEQQRWKPIIARAGIKPD